MGVKEAWKREEEFGEAQGYFDVKAAWEQQQASGEQNAGYFNVREQWIHQNTWNIQRNIYDRYSTWHDNSDRFYQAYNNRFRDRKWNYEDSYTADSGQWLSAMSSQREALNKDAAEINYLIETYGSYMPDQDFIKGVSSELRQSVNSYDDIISVAQQDAEYWKSWGEPKTGFDLYDDIAAAIPNYGQAAYTQWQEASRNQAEILNFDIPAAQAEIAELKEKRDAYIAERGSEVASIDYVGDLPADGSTPYDARIAELEQKIANTEYLREYTSYTDVMRENDYAIGSRYVSTYGAGTETYDWRHGWEGSKFGDLTYDAINKNPDAVEELKVEDYKNDRGLTGDDYGFLQSMTEDEIGIYNYLYATQSPEEAWDYILFLKGDLKARELTQKQQGWAAEAEEHPVLSSIFSVLISPMKVVTYGAQAVDYFTDGTIDPYAGYNDFSYMPSTMRAAVSETVKNGWSGKVGSFFYNTGMSMADFLYTTGITGGNQALSLAIMGAGAAADSTLAAKSRGLSDGKAFAIGTIAGIAEVAMEKISLGAWLDGDLSEGALKYLLKNALSEGFEEVGTDVINLLADVMIAGDKSEWKTAMNKYMAENPKMSEAEAFGLVAADQAAQMGLDFLGGALSGFAIAGGTYAGSSIAANHSYGDIAKNGDYVNALVAEALEIDPENSLALRMQERLQAGKNVTALQVRELVQQNETGMVKNDQTAIRTAAGNRLTELGEAGDVSGIAAALAKQATGDTLTFAERRAIRNSTYGTRVANELNIENIDSGGFSSDWAQRIGTDRINAETYGKLMQELEAEDAASVEAETEGTEALSLEKIARKYGAQAGAFEATYQRGDGNQDIQKYDQSYEYLYNYGKEGGRLEAIAEDDAVASYLTKEQQEYAYEAGKAAAEGKTALKETGEAVKVKAVASLENGKMRLELENGKVVDAEQIEFSDNAALLYHVISGMNISAREATALLNGYDGSITMEAYASGIQLAYDYGGMGRDYKSMDSRAFAAGLPEAVRKNAYTFGRKALATQNNGSYNKNKNGTEVVTNGTEDIHLRQGSQRADGENSGGQVRSLEEGTGSVQKRGKKTRSESGKDSGNQEAAGLQVSTRDLGIPDGSEEKNLRLYAGKETADIRGAKAVAKKHGLKIVLFEGGKLTINGKNGTFTARAFIQGDTTYVQADNPDFTATQLARHEAGHAQISMGEIDLAQVRKKLEAAVMPENVDWLIEEYLSGFGEDSGMTAEEVFEEIVCDSLAEMNVFAGTAMAEDIQLLLDEVQATAEAETDGKTTRGPPVDVESKTSRGYWRPKLTKAEWSLLERTMDREIETSDNYIDEATKWLYAESKGERVFAIYGIGDGTVPTLLYAVGWKNASNYHKKLTDYLEGKHNGINKTGINLGRWLRVVPNKQGKSGVSVYANGKRIAAEGNDLVSGRTREGNRAGDPGRGEKNRGKLSRELDSKGRELSKGQQTDAIIALDPEQVKNTDNLNQTKDADIRFSREFTREEADEHRNAAVSHFGKTYKWSETGYLLTDGTKLDFSGKHNGARGGYRTVDHRDITEALGEDYGGGSYSGGMVYFVQEGNIRISPESGGINLQAAPTKAQEEALTDFISRANRGEVILDIDDSQGNTISSTEYPRGTRASKVIADIRRFFEDGTKPFVSTVSQFHFSREFIQAQMTEREIQLAKVNKALEKDNAKLKEDNQYLKELLNIQKEVTGGTKFTKSSVEAMARQLKTKVNASGETKELASILNSFYEFIATAKELTWEDVMEQAQAAVDWLNDHKRKDFVRDEYAQTVLDELWGRSFYLDESQKGEAAYAYGSYQAFRQKVWGTMTVSDQATMSLDELWKEMSAEHPYYFPKDTGSGDQVTALLDVLDALKNARAVDELSMDDSFKEMAERELLHDVYDSFWRVATLRTVADAKQREINALKSKHYTKMEQLKADHKEATKKLEAEYRQRMEKLRRDYRDRTEQKIRGVKEAAREIRQNEAARRKESDLVQKYRGRVEAKAKTLTEKLLKNSDKEHIPEVLKTVVGDFLQSIDFSSKTKAQGRGVTKRDMSYTETLDRLRQVFQNQANAMNDPDNSRTADFMLDMPFGFAQDIQEHIDVVKSASAGLDTNTNVVSLMSSAELQDLDYILTVITKSVTQINKLMASARFQYAMEASDATILGLRSLGQEKNTGKLAKFLQWDNTTPFYAFKRLGDAALAMFEEIQDGWDKMAMNVRTVIEYAEKTYTDEEIREWSRDIRTIELANGDKVKMSIPQIMSLYCLMKREQAMGHLMGGGMRVGDIARRKGKPIPQPDNHTLTMEDLSRITGLLSGRQIEVADKLQQYMNTVGSRWGNEVSMARFGYNSFVEKNYFPIQVDSNNLSAVHPDAKANDLFRLLNMSMTKGLTPKANNAIVVSDIFDVFADHMSDMAKYNALALPILDVMKWYNYKAQSKDEVTGQVKTATVQKAIEKAFGRNATSYIVNFVKDLNGVRDGGKGTDSFAKKMISNYKVAAVAANLRVALLQPTAYVRASAVLDSKYLVMGLKVNPLKASEEAQQYSGIAAWKALGFYDTNIARGVREQIKHDASRKEKAVEYSMKGAEMGDRVTFGYLWYACKMETKDKTGLSGEALNEATAKRFREVIYRTQVVDSTMTRSQTMRDSKSLSTLATAFMAEPTLSYNILLDAYGEYNNALRRNNGNKAIAWSTAKYAVGRAFASYALTSLASSLVSSLLDALRDDDEYEDFIDKYLEAFGENLFSDTLPFNKLPIFRDVLSYLDGFENDRMDTAWIKTIVDAGKIWYELIAVELGLQENYTDVTYNGRITWYGAIYKALQAGSRLSGVPLSNVSREIATMWNNTIGILIDAKLQTYDAGANSNIKYAYQDGYLTEAEAIQELIEQGVAKDEDEAYFTIQSWEGRNKYDDVYEAVKNGSSIDDPMQELLDHGYTREEVISQVKTQIGNWYRGTADEPQSITKQQAIDMLSRYTDMSDNEITKLVNEWSCKVVTGIEYDDIKQEYLDGNITVQRAVEMYMRYGGYTKEEAQEKVDAWLCEKETGIAYNNLKKEFLDGNVTSEKAMEIYMNYGGYDQKEASEKVTVLEFVKEHPETDGISYAAMQKYTMYCESSGMDVKVYYDCWKYCNSVSREDIPSAMKKKNIADYINSLDITEEQRGRLFYVFYLKGTE